MAANLNIFNFFISNFLQIEARKVKKYKKMIKLKTSCTYQ